MLIMNFFCTYKSCCIHGLDSLVRFLYLSLFFFYSSTAAISYNRLYLHTSLTSVVNVDGRCLLALCRFLVLAFLVLVVRISGGSNELYRRLSSSFSIAS